MFLAVRRTITGRFRVCHNKRITRNKVFRDYAERGKSIMGWCFGFKLHLICNERGELLNNTHVFLIFYVVFGMYWNVFFLTCVSNAT